MFDISFIIIRDLDYFVARFGGNVIGRLVSFTDVSFKKCHELEDFVYETRIGTTKVKSPKCVKSTTK